ncbi:MAG: hypothetical protein AAGG02_17120, partial [Cyanobacteria bacterium P01_H01_bin.15]
MKDKLPFISFIASAVFLAYLWGILTGAYRIFPFPIIKSAQDVVDEFMPGDSENATVSSRQGVRRLHSFPYRQDYSGHGVTISNPEKSDQGYTLFTAFNGEKCTNLLVDFQGNVVHEWYIKFSDVWGKDAPFLEQQFSDEFTCWQGTQLLPNGELIATFIDNGRPYCGGLVKINLDSEIVWSLPKCTHHDVHIGEDGLLYAPGMYLVEKDESNPESGGERYLKLRQLPTTPSNTQYWGTPILRDTVVVASIDGNFIEELDVLDAFFNSDYRTSLSTKHFRPQQHTQQTYDPTHVNDIELITEEWAKHHPKINAGDIM